MTLQATFLGNLELSPHARLRGLDAPRLTYEDKRTIGGKLVYRAATAIKGRTLTLDLTEHHATMGQIEAVRNMIDAGTPVILRHHTFTGQVRVDGIENLTPSIDYADAKGQDWASAEIRMTEL